LFYRDSRECIQVRAVAYVICLLNLSCTAVIIPPPLQTAVAEALAQRIVSNDVPEALQGRTLMALDMGALIAGNGAEPALFH
jgi:hypothetical protein